MNQNRIGFVSLLLVASIYLLHTILFVLLGAKLLYLFTVSVMIFFLFCWIILGRTGLESLNYFTPMLFFLFSAVVAVATGGVHSSAIFLMAIIPLIGLLMMPLKPALGLSGVTALCLILIGLAEHFQIRIALFHPLVNVNVFHTIYIFLTCLSCSVLGICLALKHHIELCALNDRQSHLELSKEKADNAVQAKQDFLANMSHEIRNPMNGIIGMLHVVLESRLDNKQRKYLNIVYSSARALLTIVNDILDLSKIEAGKMDLDIRNFDLRVAMEDITALPALQARQKGIEFSYRIVPEVPCRIKGDPGRIRQVINNLTGNAIKFTQNGEVSLEVSLVSETDTQAVIRFAVDDTGIGISADKIESLFDSFTQADVSTTKRYGGTGLGLSISRRLVERMNGRIGADSIEMVGSTFWFEIPLDKQEEDTWVDDLFSIEISHLKVLLTSDDIQVCGAVENILAELGLEYETAQDYIEAKEKLLHAAALGYPFHILIADIQEGDETAEHFGKQVLQDNRLSYIKMIILTAVGKKGDARRFQDAGFSAFLSKPVDRSLLQDCFKAVLARREKPDQTIITRYSIQETKKHLIRILIVDDQETNRLTAKALLDRLGYASSSAENGEQALNRHKAQPFDLILMDCQMPEMDGFETTRQIRVFETDQSYHTPVIAMTGNAFQRDREMCAEAGMDDFIAKPIEPESLDAKIRSNLVELFQFKQIQADSKTLPDCVMDHGNEIDTGLDNEARPVRFDRQRLLERVGDSTEIAQTIIDSFFVEAPELLDGIHTAIKGNDSESLKQYAHALKGSSANVNADRLSRFAATLEDESEQSDMSPVKKQFEVLKQEYEALSGELTL